MTNTLVLTFSEIERLMEKAGVHVIDCDVPLADDLAERMPENNTGEFGCEISLLMNTYVHLKVNNMLEHVDVDVLLREMLWEGVKPLSIEEIVLEYFYKWCNKGVLKIQSKTSDTVTIISNDGSELNEERLFELFKHELYELLT